MTATRKPPTPVIPAPDNAQLPAYDVRALTGEDGQAGLVLDGVLYRLRITRLGKLILTK